MKRFVNLLRAVLPKRAKQQFKRILGLPATRMHPDWKILTATGPVSESHVVIDLGARNGWFFSCWQKWCPSAVIHAFEPDKNAYDALVSKYAGDPSIFLDQRGIGASNCTKKFYHLGGSEVSSSFLQHNPEVWADLNFDPGEISTSNIGITTLDSYCLEAQVNAVHLIKIDIQGFELEALKGANRILGSTNYVFVESCIKPLYAGAACFTEVHDYLAERGFHLMDLRAWHNGSHVLMETDMLFRRDKLIPLASESLPDQRVYVGSA